MLKRGTVEPVMDDGTLLEGEVLNNLHLSEIDLTTLKVQNRDANEKIRRLITEAKNRIERVREKTEEQIDKVFQPDELSPGVVQLVKVYIAEKRKISVGDKMAGRHGNKGIIARIVPEEDMPFPAERFACGNRAEPARCAEPYERRPDPRDDVGLGLPAARLRGEDAGVPGRVRR